MRVNVLMRGVKCKNAPFHRKKSPISSQKSPISSQNGHSGAKTGKVSDWYQSDNYL